eukprot:992275-Rhodomonas_salina.1
MAHTRRALRGAASATGPVVPYPSQYRTARSRRVASYPSQYRTARSRRVASYPSHYCTARSTIPSRRVAPYPRSVPHVPV